MLRDNGRFTNTPSYTHQMGTTQMMVDITIVKVTNQNAGNIENFGYLFENCNLK